MKKFLILIFCLAAGYFSKAQNLHFSQYQMFPLALNPALTGNTDADFRIAAIHRQQWKTFNTLFETTGISAESSLKNILLPKNKLGVGLAFINDDQGSIIKDIHLGLSLAYHHVFGANNRAQLSFGVQGNYRQTQIDYTSLQFGDQYEYFEFNPNLATSESLTNDLYGNISLNAGIAISYVLSPKTRIDGGLAIFNMLKPGNSALGFSGKTIAGALAHVGVNFKLNERLSTYPNLRVIYQGGGFNAIVGNELGYLISPNQRIKLYAGAYYRYRDAAIISGGLQWKDLKIMGAYDFTVSGFNSVKSALENNKNAGAFEIALILELQKSQTSTIPVTVPCKIF